MRSFKLYVTSGLMLLACGGGGVALTLDAGGVDGRPAGQVGTAPGSQEFVRTLDGGIGGGPGGGSPGGPGTTTVPTGETGGFGVSSPNVVGVGGVAAYEALSTTQRDALRGRGVFFIHKSVGEDMVSGSEALGVKWEYAGTPSDFNGRILGSALYNTPNGNPLPKMDEFSSFVLGAPAGLEAAAMKFGYADIEDSKNLPAVQAKYESMMATLALRKPGVRILHITPALTLGGGGDVGQNKFRAQFGEWMKRKYSPTAIVFDLQDVESLDANGTRCTRDGGPRLCERDRYKGGGPNGPADTESQGHLSPDAAQRVAKAFLFALHRAFAL